MGEAQQDRVMKKFDELITEYEGVRFDELPKFMKRRVDALKKLQLEHTKLLHQYNLKLQELELEFDKLHQPLFEKRAKIVKGEYEPTDEECQLPTTIAENGDQENAGQMPLLTQDEETSLKSKVKGLPGFWLGCLSSTYNFSESIEEHDRPVLKFLKDIKLVYEQKEDILVYKLEFYFDENPYFTNSVLTKTYYLQSKPDEKNPFTYEGFEVTKSEGCTINWNPGKDITVAMKKVKQQNKHNGQTREKTKQVERDSFFYFFKPPQVPEGGEDEIDEDLGAVMAVDFELGELIRQSLIPKAALYYAGYMMEDDDDEDDDDEDDDDSDGCEFDESDLDESDDCESSDSLVKKDK